MRLGKLAKQLWRVAGYTGEALDFLADVIAIGKTVPKGTTEAVERKPMEKIKARIADIGRGDETIIARLLGKLGDKDRAIFLGFKMWLAEKDKIRYFILRRHLTFVYEKSEKEALELMFDIVSKLEAGGNEATLEYCDGMEITHDSTIAMLKTAYEKVLLPTGKTIRTQAEGLYNRVNADCAEDGAIGREVIALRQLSENFRQSRRR